MSSILLLLTTYPRPIAALLTLALLACAARSWRWPMALDAVLLACYVARPSLQLLVLGSFLAALRWVPPFAAQVAEALRVPEWGGLSLPVALFALPGLQAYVRGPARGVPARAAELPPVVAATGRTTRLDPVQAPAVHARPLAPAEWMRACNDDPAAPHLGIVGPTQYGKTTFALALAGRRQGEFVITTTKPDTWGGADVVRPTITLDGEKATVDWSPISRAIGKVHFEMLRRNLQNDFSGPPISLIIDEIVTTFANVARETVDQVIEMWNMGAASGVHVTGIAQEFNARAWRVEGRRDVLNNLFFCQVETGRLWAMGRMDPNGRLLDPQPLDTAALVTLAADAQLAGRGWSGVAVAVPAAGGSVPVPPAGTPPQQAPGNVPNGNGNDDVIIAALMKLRRAGASRDDARALGLSFRDENWTKAGERLRNGTK